MTALLVEDHREPRDCPYQWGLDGPACAYHDLPVHRCLIQSRHENPCICMCGASPVTPPPRPTRWRWTGFLTERAVRRARRATRDALNPYEPREVERP